MATLRKRGPYQWQAQVRKKGQSPQTKTFKTRALAEQWARAIEVEMDKGVFVSRAGAETTTLEELLDRYLADNAPLSGFFPCPTSATNDETIPSFGKIIST